MKRILAILGLFAITAGLTHAAIYDLIPSSNGPAAGGNTLIITNYSGAFGSGSDITNVVFSNFTQAAFSTNIPAQGTNWVQVVVPAHVAGAVDILIQSFGPAGETTLSAHQYTFNPAGVIGASGEAPGLTCRYEFNGTLQDTLTNGLDMVPVDTTTNRYALDGWQWTSTSNAGGGLRFDGPSNMASIFTNYSIGIRFKYDDTGAGYHYRKIVDFKNRAKDDGFYFYNQKLSFYLSGPHNGITVVSNNTFVDFVLAYNGSSSTIDVYTVSGTNVEREFGVKDSGGVAVPTNVAGRPRLMLFMDDLAVSGEATPGGTVRRIKLWDRPLTREEILAAMNGFSGVTPESGSYTGGYPVVISGTNLCNGIQSDVTNVTLCGVTAMVASVAGSTQVVVTAGVAPNVSVLGDVRVYSTSYGITIKSNAFTYLVPGMSVLGTNGAVVASGEAASTTKGTYFSSLAWGLARTNTFPITNSGNIALTIGVVTTNGTGALAFSISDLGFSIAAGGVSNFTVRFAPPAVGTYTAAVHIVNDSTTTPYIIYLAGVGTKATATVTLTNLNWTYDGTSKSASYTTTPTGLFANVTYNGGLTAPSAAGSYAVTATVSEVAYTGSIAGTLVIAKATQTVSFTAIPMQVATGSVGLAATASSTLPVTFGLVDGPGTMLSATQLGFTAAGTVLVRASQAGDGNWNAAATTNTVIVTKAAASVVLTNLTHIYNGASKSASATTVPSGLTVQLTYDGSATAPANAGSYAVTGVVSDTVYAGTNSATLTISNGTPTITFPQIPDLYINRTNVLAATSSSGLPVSFAVTNGPGTIDNLTNLHFSNTGYVSVVASDAGNSNWNPASVTNTFFVHNVLIWLGGTNGQLVMNSEPYSLAKGTDYGRVGIGTVWTNRFRLGNEGTADLIVTNWTTNGMGASAFTVVSVDTNVAPGGASNIVIAFTPADAQVYTAAVVIAHNGTTNAPFMLYLSGTGASAATLGVSNVTFATAYGTDPADRSFVVTNLGQAACVFTQNVTQGAGTWLTVTPAGAALDGGGRRP